MEPVLIQPQMDMRPIGVRRQPIVPRQDRRRLQPVGGAGGAGGVGALGGAFDIMVGALEGDGQLGGLTLDGAMDIPNRDNLHICLQEMMEKFKLSAETFDSIANKVDSNKIGELCQQLKLLKFTINNSSKMMFNLNLLESKYPLVIYFIKEHHMKKDKSSDKSSQIKELDKSSGLDYNELLKGFDTQRLGSLSLSEILRFKSMTDLKTRKEENRDVVNKFNKELQSRNLTNVWLEQNEIKPKKESENTTETTTHKTPDVCVISKKSLLAIIEELETIYNVIASRNQWKTYIEYIQQTIKTSFDNYCKTSQKYQYLMEIKKQLTIK